MPARRRNSIRRRAPVRRYSRPARRRRVAPRRPARGPRTKGPCVCPSELTPGLKFAMAQIDPFSTLVMGAKIPDSNTQPSISTADTEQVALISAPTSTHLNVTAYRPTYKGGTVNATPGVSATWPATFGGQVDRTKLTAYNAAIELTRPVAHAIRITSPVSPTTASGFVHVAISTESTFGATTWQYPTTVAQMSGLQFYKRVTLASLTQSPLTIINKWIDDTAFRYSSPNSGIETGTSGTFQTDYSWGAIIVMTEGVPVATTVISAEHFLMSEGIPDKNSPIVGTPASIASPGIMAATSDMQSHIDGIHTEQEQDGYITRSANALIAGAAAQGEAVFDNVAIPVLQAVGRGAVNMAVQAGAAAYGIGGVNNNANRIAG